MIQVENINLNNAKRHDEVTLSSSYAMIKIGQYESNQPHVLTQPITTATKSTTTINFNSNVMGK